MPHFSLYSRKSFWTAYAVLGLAIWSLIERSAARSSVDIYDARTAFILYWLVGACFFSIIIIGLKRRTEATLLVIGVSLALLCSELALRYLAPEEAYPALAHLQSPDLHHRLPANAKLFHGFFDGQPIVVETNIDGLRTQYSPTDFLQYKTRIAVLGDSFAFGYGVTKDDSFTAVMEGKLRERAPNAHTAVLNAGITSYSPFLEKRAVHTILTSYKPHIVVLLLDAGDIGDDYRYENESTSNSHTGALTFPLKDQISPHYYGALWNFLQKNKSFFLAPLDALNLRNSLPEQPTYDYYDFTLEIGGTTETNRFFHYRHPLSLTKPYFDKTWGHINDIAHSVKATSATFLLVVAPRYHHWNTEESPNNWELDRYELEEPYQYEYLKYFSQRGQQASFNVHSLLKTFQSTTEFPLVFDEDPHWNKKGHRIVGEVMTDYVADASPQIFGTKP